MRLRHCGIALVACSVVALAAAALPGVAPPSRTVAPRATTAPRAAPPSAFPAFVPPMTDGRPNPFGWMSPKFQRTMLTLDARLTGVGREQGVDALRALIRNELAEKPFMERSHIILWATELGYAWCADILFDRLSTTDATERRTISSFIACTPTPRGGWRPDPAAVDRLIAVETDPGIVHDLKEIKAWCVR